MGYLHRESPKPLINVAPDVPTTPEQTRVDPSIASLTGAPISDQPLAGTLPPSPASPPDIPRTFSMAQNPLVPDGTVLNPAETAVYRGGNKSL